MSSASAVRLSPSVQKQKLKLELLRGSRLKLESLPVSVVVHEHLVRAGCMFFGTATRRTLTRLHRHRKLVRRTRSMHSRTRAPAKLVSTTMDFRAFVAKAPHLTIPRQRTPVYGGKLLFSNATAKIPKAISQKRHDGFSFLNDGNLDKCLSKKKSRLATPALWLSSPH